MGSKFNWGRALSSAGRSLEDYFVQKGAQEQRAQEIADARQYQMDMYNLRDPLVNASAAGLAPASPVINPTGLGPQGAQIPNQVRLSHASKLKDLFGQPAPLVKSTPVMHTFPDGTVGYGTEGEGGVKLGRYRLPEAPETLDPQVLYSDPYEIMVGGKSVLVKKNLLTKEVERIDSHAPSGSGSTSDSVDSPYSYSSADRKAILDNGIGKLHFSKGEGMIHPGRLLNEPGLNNGDDFYNAVYGAANDSLITGRYSGDRSIDLAARDVLGGGNFDLVGDEYLNDTFGWDGYDADAGGFFDERMTWRGKVKEFTNNVDAAQKIAKAINTSENETLTFQMIRQSLADQGVDDDTIGELLPLVNALDPETKREMVEEDPVARELLESLKRELTGVQ